jgi:hypothetical protein
MRVRVACSDGKFKIETDPHKVDALAIAAWEPIHNGNVSKHAEKCLFASLRANYGQHCFDQEAFPLDPITGQQVRAGIVKSPDNSRGLDGVSKGDLAILSGLGCEWLAALFNFIEGGAEWPC